MEDTRSRNASNSVRMIYPKQKMKGGNSQSSTGISRTKGGGGVGRKRMISKRGGKKKGKISNPISIAAIGCIRVPKSNQAAPVRFP